MGKRRDGAKERFWRRAVAEQPRSGLSVREFCRVRGLSESSFYFWKQELNRRRRERRVKTASAQKPPPAVTFAEIRLAPPQAVRDVSATIEIALPGQRIVRVPVGFDRETLRQVVAVLEDRTC